MAQSQGAAPVDAAPSWDVADLQRLLAPPARTAAGWVPGPPAGSPIILFTAGVPDAPSFPVKQIGTAVQTVLQREAAPALEYLLGSPAGVPRLRELIYSRMEPEAGVALSVENITVTSGSAAALANIMQTFVAPGDTVVFEGPSYGGAVRTAQGAGARFATVPVTDQGVDLDALDSTLTRLTAEGRRPKLFYTMPTFHNPAGTTMPLEHRLRLIDLAAKHRVLIVEDDAYGEIRFTADQIPSLFTLAGGHGVLRCGTVSKTIAPGLRVGWIKGAAPLIDALVRMRFDNGTSPFVQRTVMAYVESGAFEPHVAAMRALYKQKFETMEAALGEHCSRFLRWSQPAGGFFIWARLAEGMTCHTLREAAWDEGVDVYPGSSFFDYDGGTGYIRLAFSAVALDQIGEGCARLGRALARAAAQS